MQRTTASPARRPRLLAPAVVVVAIAIAIVSVACKQESKAPAAPAAKATIEPATSAPAPVPIAAAPAGPTRCRGEKYQAQSDIPHYWAIGLDVRDLREALAKGDWSAASAIYANGKHQQRADGTVRSLASLAVAGAEHVPQGAAAHGRASFIDAMIRDGFKGVGRAHGNSDAVRRAAVEAGLVWIIHAKVLEELEKTAKHIAANELDPKKQAPKTVDEGWAGLACAADARGERPYCTLGLAARLEETAGLSGTLCEPLEDAFVAALRAARTGDGAAFAARRVEIVGRLHALSYRQTLRALDAAVASTTPEVRAGHLAEAWAYWQILRAPMHIASSAAAQTVEATIATTPREPFTSAALAKVREALHEPQVWAALAIPEALKAP